jgi:hypothetical protein
LQSKHVSEPLNGLLETYHPPVKHWTELREELDSKREDLGWLLYLHKYPRDWKSKGQKKLYYTTLPDDPLFPLEEPVNFKDKKNPNNK